MTAGIKVYFLATPMVRPEFMKVQYKYIPKDIRVKYKLHDKLTSQDYIYILINKGMYGLKQAIILAYDNLKEIMKPYGYAPIIGTVGLREHKIHSTTFFLTMDDFGINYSNKQDAQHFLDAIGQT